MYDRANFYSRKAYQEAYEAEKHLHNRELWFGEAASRDAGVNEGDSDSKVPYGTTGGLELDGGNDTWGSWLMLLGTGDTPVQAARIKYDAHRFVVTDSERNKIPTRIQLSTGAAGSEVIVSELVCQPYSAATAVDPPFNILCPRIDVGTELSARIWVMGQDTGKLYMFAGIHEYLK